MRIPQTVNPLKNDIIKSVIVKINNLADKSAVMLISLGVHLTLTDIWDTSERLERKSKDRPTRTPDVVFVVESHYQTLQIIVLLLQACRLEIYLFCKI